MYVALVGQQPAAPVTVVYVAQPQVVVKLQGQPNSGMLLSATPNGVNATTLVGSTNTMSSGKYNQFNQLEDTKMNINSNKRGRVNIKHYNQEQGSVFNLRV